MIQHDKFLEQRITRKIVQNKAQKMKNREKYNELKKR